MFADNAVAAAIKYVSIRKLKCEKKMSRMAKPRRLPAIILDQNGIHE